MSDQEMDAIAEELGAALGTWLGERDISMEYVQIIFFTIRYHFMTPPLERRQHTVIDLRNAPLLMQ